MSSDQKDRETFVVCWEVTKPGGSTETADAHSTTNIEQQCETLDEAERLITKLEQLQSPPNYISLHKNIYRYLWCKSYD